jgi:hypothetical protein
VDYQDTSEDFWRIVNDVKPIAIITFSRSNIGRPPRWEVEAVQRNLEEWIDDYEEPYQPTPAPPDDSVPAGYVRHSSLPMYEIVDAVNADPMNVNAFVDENGYGGGVLSEFMAYHGTWYHDIHADPDDPQWNIAAGHVHVSGNMPLADAINATEITLRTVIGYVDANVPEPATGLLAIPALCLMRGVRRRY